MKTEKTDPTTEVAPAMKSAVLDTEKELAQAHARKAADQEKLTAKEKEYEEAEAKSMANESLKDAKRAAELAVEVDALKKFLTKRDLEIRDAEEKRQAAQRDDAVENFRTIDRSRQFLVGDFVKNFIPEVRRQAQEKLQAIVDSERATDNALEYAVSLGASRPTNTEWPKLAPSFLVTVWDPKLRAVVPDVVPSVSKALQDEVEAPLREAEKRARDEGRARERAKLEREARLRGEEGEAAREAELARVRAEMATMYGRPPDLSSGDRR